MGPAPEDFLRGFEAFREFYLGDAEEFQQKNSRLQDDVNFKQKMEQCLKSLLILMQKMMKINR